MADAFSSALIANTPNEIATYHTFLQAGSSDYPVSVLKNAGVDRMTDKPVEDLLTDFDVTVSGMNDILVKLGKVK